MIFIERFARRSNWFLNEASSPAQSANPDWWLSSGGYFEFNAGVFAATNFGPLPESDPWRTAYSISNSLDTEDGYKPQNLFRVVTRCQWLDIDQSVVFHIYTTNLTDTPNRDGYSGIFLFNRYQDQHNLYYLGLRHDGQAVIKRKRNGLYTTLAAAQVYPGTYHRDTNPNLLPKQRHISIRSVVTNVGDDTVDLRLELHDFTLQPTWHTVVSAQDTHADRIMTSGRAGIRTDYMDVSFSGYVAAEAGSLVLGK